MKGYYMNVIWQLKHKKSVELEKTYIPITIARRNIDGLTIKSNDLDLLTCIHGTWKTEILDNFLWIQSWVLQLCDLWTTQSYTVSETPSIRQSKARVVHLWVSFCQIPRDADMVAGALIWGYTEQSVVFNNSNCLL